MIVNMFIIHVISPKLEVYYFIKDAETKRELLHSSVTVFPYCIRDFGGRQIIAIILLFLKYNHCRIRREQARNLLILGQNRWFFCE